MILEKIRYRPAYCLTCRLPEGAGDCSYCNERWTAIAGNIRKVFEARIIDPPYP